MTFNQIQFTAILSPFWCNCNPDVKNLQLPLKIQHKSFFLYLGQSKTAFCQLCESFTKQHILISNLGFGKPVSASGLPIKCNMYTGWGSHWSEAVAIKNPRGVWLAGGNAVQLTAAVIFAFPTSWKFFLLYWPHRCLMSLLYIIWPGHVPLLGSTESPEAKRDTSWNCWSHGWCSLEEKQIFIKVNFLQHSDHVGRILVV